MGVLRGFCDACLASGSVTTQYAACALTGQEADLDGVCVEHGETACVMTVHAAPAVSESTIPGCQCTHGDDIYPAQRLPIEGD